MQQRFHLVARAEHGGAGKGFLPLADEHVLYDAVPADLLYLAGVVVDPHLEGRHHVGVVIELLVRKGEHRWHVLVAGNDHEAVLRVENVKRGILRVADDFGAAHQRLALAFEETLRDNGGLLLGDRLRESEPAKGDTNEGEVYFSHIERIISQAAKIHFF